MIINIKQKDITNDEPIVVTPKEFWVQWITLRNPKNLTEKQIEIVAEHLSGTQPESPKGRYKAAITALKKKGINLEPREAPQQATLQIKLKVERSS